jgi:hypothetical protein
MFSPETSGCFRQGFVQRHPYLPWQLVNRLRYSQALSGVVKGARYGSGNFNQQ